MYLSSYVAEFDTIRFVSYIDIQANGKGWTMVPGGPLKYPARIVAVHNLTDATLLLSNVGSLPANDKWLLPFNSGRVIDVTSNTFNTNMTGIFALPIGTLFYIRELDDPFTEVPNEMGVWIEIAYGSEHQ